MAEKKKEYKISVVIRTYNEHKHLGEVLESLSNQTMKDFEVIQVDSESTDNTLNISKKYDFVKVIPIKKADFNYSYASNVGVQNSSGDIVVFLSGHSVPVKPTYLKDILDVFENSSVGACYGDVIALPDGSWIEKAFNKAGYIKNKLKGGSKGTELETEIHGGIFSCSNAAARRKLLLEHPFSEELGRGGEDVEVAYRIIQDGYYVAKVPDLLVMHSHGKGLVAFAKEVKSWKVMYQDVLKYISKDKRE